jgi:hypothetical protein
MKITLKELRKVVQQVIKESYGINDVYGGSPTESKLESDTQSESGESTVEWVLLNANPVSDNEVMKDYPEAYDELFSSTQNDNTTVDFLKFNDLLLAHHLEDNVVSWWDGKYWDEFDKDNVEAYEQAIAPEEVEEPEFVDDRDIPDYMRWQHRKAKSAENLRKMDDADFSPSE